MSVDKRSHAAAAMPPTCDSDLCMCDSTVPIPHLLPSVNFFPLPFAGRSSVFYSSCQVMPPLHSNPLPLLEPPLLTPLLTLPSFGPESGCGGTAACLATLACHPSFRSCLVSGFGGVLQTPVARGKKNLLRNGRGRQRSSPIPN